MLDEVIACKDLFKPAGVVVGSLVANAETKLLEPDLKFVDQVVEEVGGKMTVTFHKASDQMSQYSEGIQKIVEHKVD